MALWERKEMNSEYGLKKYMIEMLREGKRERDRKRDTQERKRRWEKMKVMSSYISFFLSFLSLFLFNPIRTVGGGDGLTYMGRKFWKIFKSLILRHSQHPQNWNFLSKTFNGSICAYSILYPQIFWRIEGWGGGAGWNQTPLPPKKSLTFFIRVCNFVW